MEANTVTFPADAPLLMTIATAMEALAVSRTTIYRMVKAGELEAVGIGKSTRIRTASIQKVAASGAKTRKAA